MKTITDLPLLFLDLLEPQRFVRQNLRDIDEITTPSDLAIVSHLPDDAVGVVLNRREFAGVRAHRTRINTSWSLSSERLMRALVIILDCAPRSGEVSPRF